MPRIRCECLDTDVKATLGAALKNTIAINEGEFGKVARRKALAEGGLVGGGDLDEARRLLDDLLAVPSCVTEVETE